MAAAGLGAGADELADGPEAGGPEAGDPEAGEGAEGAADEAVTRLGDDADEGDDGATPVGVGATMCVGCEVESCSGADSPTPPQALSATTAAHAVPVRTTRFRAHRGPVAAATRRIASAGRSGAMAEPARQRRHGANVPNASTR